MSNLKDKKDNKDNKNTDINNINNIYICPKCKNVIINEIKDGSILC